MQPPLAGMCSPPAHVRFVVASRIGLRTGTAMLNAQPRGCCSSRTVTREGYSVTRPRRRAGRHAGRIVAMSFPYVALVPVKPPGRGKTRLGDLPRDELAAAFAADA